MKDIREKNLAAVDLNLLKAFDAMLSEKRVAVAGAKIGLTQPAMSNALNRLRRLFEDELFVSTPQGMQPTARARHLAGPLQNALREISLALQRAPDFDPRATRTTLSVGITDFSGVGLALRLATRIPALAPHLCLRIRYVDARAVPQLLDDEAVDVAVGVRPMPASRCETSLLFGEQASFVMREGHPAAADFTLSALLAYPHLLVAPSMETIGTIDPELQKLGFRRTILMTVPDLVTVPTVLRASDLIIALARRTADEIVRFGGLVVLPSPVELPTYNVHMTWHCRDTEDPAKAWLRGVLTVLATEITEPAMTPAAPWP